jgi:hypothetical protein
MNPMLKRNICELPQYAMNKDISDLSSRHERYIGAPLMYACEFWTNHLRLSNAAYDDTGADIVKSVNLFFDENLLS